jgi:hypothetical protein
VATGGFGFNATGRMAPGLWNDKDDLTWAAYNLSWSSIPRLDLVGEFLSGQRFNKDGEKGIASQWQFGTRFRF